MVLRPKQSSVLGLFLYAFASVCLEECLDLGVFSFPTAILDWHMKRSSAAAII